MTDTPKRGNKNSVLNSQAQKAAYSNGCNTSRKAFRQHDNRQALEDGGTSKVNPSTRVCRLAVLFKRLAVGGAVRIREAPHAKPIRCAPPSGG